MYCTRGQRRTCGGGDRVHSRGEGKRVASKPPGPANLCKKERARSQNVRETNPGKAKEMGDGTRRTLDHDVNGVCKSNTVSFRKMSQSETSEERKDGLLTIVLHVQRLGRIIVVDPSPIIQKPIFVLFCFFTRAPETKKVSSQP